MADYRRFISYMYLYENGRKTVNSGFVRVESRNGQCRVHIHMTGIYGPENENYTVYMLIRENGGYIGITTGLLRMGQQTGELDLSTDSSHLMATDYGLERVSGMVVLSDSGRLYGTRWDDEPLETEHFVSAREVSGRLTLFSAENQQPMSGSAPALVPGSLASGTLEEMADSVKDDLSKESAEALTEGSVIVETEELTEESIEAEAETPAEEAEAAGEKVSVEEQETAESDDRHLFHGNQQEQENAYEVLLHQYPQMYPFDDNSVEICIRMDLQDIGKLPMQCWLYGSNSFLLHGYYCYRHLILARMCLQTDDGEDGGAVYIFGVPGIRQHREQYMASMFGFNNFKPVSKENTGGGAFGYWYVRLDAAR